MPHGSGLTLNVAIGVARLLRQLVILLRSVARGLSVRSSSRVRVFIMVRRLELSMRIIMRKRMRRIRIVSLILQYKIGPMLG